MSLLEQPILKISQGIEEYTLDNDLQVLLKPVETSSAVSVWVFYKVGSRNENIGTTGSSHFCEHMLFKGGGKLGKGDVFKLISSEGGTNNAFTDKDLTAYYETLPKEKLDIGLFIESERMANSAFLSEDVESERTVVISEREGGENYPMYLLREEMYALAYHAHPYHWPVVGWKNDLRRVSREDLFNHYKKFYHPGNAVLVVAGNLGRLSETKKTIQSHFGKISGAESIPNDLRLEEPEQFGERKSEITRKGALDYMIMGFKMPATVNADTPCLLVLAAILGGWQGLIGFFGNRGGFVSKSNRLYKRLVEGKIASDVTLRFPVSIDPDLMTVEVTVMPESSIKKSEEALLEEITKVCDKAPSPDELRVAFNQIRSWYAYENDGVTSKALTLGTSVVLNNSSLIEDLIRTSLATSPDEVSKVARKYLGDEKKRIVCAYRSTNA